SVVDDLELAPDELAHARLRLVHRAARRVPEVEERLAAPGDDVRGDAAVDLRHAQHLAEDEAVDVDVARLEPDDVAEAFDGEGDSVDSEPGPGRVRGLALEDDAGNQVAEAAELERVVGRLEADDECRLVDRRGRVEKGGERI